MQLIYNTTHGFLLQAGGEQVHAASACGWFACRPEELIQVFVVGAVLVTAILSIVCAFYFFREDKEDSMSPLCPELVVAQERMFSMVLVPSVADKADESAQGSAVQDAPAAAVQEPVATSIEGAEEGCQGAAVQVAPLVAVQAPVAASIESTEEGCQGTAEPLRRQVALQSTEGKVEGFKNVCQVFIDYPVEDPFRPGAASAVAATVRLVSLGDVRNALASVVIRNVSMQGHGLALCRSTSDIFGFLEPDSTSKSRYHVRHRTGTHVMTLAGDFVSIDCMSVGFFNPARVQVGSIMLKDGKCTGRVLQQIDAGLMLVSFLGAYVHRRLKALAPPEVVPAKVVEEPPTFGGRGMPGMVERIEEAKAREEPASEKFEQDAESPARPQSEPAGSSQVATDRDEEWQA